MIPSYLFLFLWWKNGTYIINLVNGVTPPEHMVNCMYISLKNSAIVYDLRLAVNGI